MKRGPWGLYEWGAFFFCCVVGGGASVLLTMSGC